MKEYELEVKLRRRYGRHWRFLFLMLMKEGLLSFDVALVGVGLWTAESLDCFECNDDEGIIVLVSSPALHFFCHHFHF